MSQLAYYEGHEGEWSRRLAAGHVMWDKGAYDAFYMRGFVMRMLAETGFDQRLGRVLELGCGTGPLACLLAEKGFDVVAVDVAPSAIAFAREQAAVRRLAIDFQVRDVVRQGVPSGPFDIVIDSHLLHCLVPLADRERMLRAVRAAMASDGEFWTETMAMTDRVIADPDWYLDNEGVTWTKLSRAGRYIDEVECRGQVWLPIRRIRPVAALLAELTDAGFTVAYDDVEEPSRPHEPAILRALCVTDPARGAGPRSAG